MSSIIAAKGAEKASKALTGDIYVRKWTSVSGKGKHKKAVEHEVRVNAVTGAVVAVGAALTAGLGMAALWMAQRKLSRKTTDDGDYGHDLVLVLDIYDTTYKTVTVVDEPAYDETLYWQVIRGTPTLISKETYDSLLGTGAVLYTDVVHYDAVTHEETVVDVPGYAYVKSKRGVPYKKVDSPNYTNVLTQYQLSKGYVWKEETKSVSLYDKDDKKIGNRVWWRFHTDQKQTYELGERTGFLS